MKKTILAVIVGTMASANSFAGPANELIKQAVRSEEVAAATAIANKMSRKGLEAQVAMESIVKNSRRELVADHKGVTAVLQVSNNGQRGVLHTMAIDGEGNAIRTAVPISEASTIPTETSIMQYANNTTVTREFETAAGKVNVTQTIETGYKKAGIVNQSQFSIETPTFAAEAQNVGSNLPGGGFLTGARLTFTAEGRSISRTIFVEEGFIINAAKINTTGTKLTVLASKGSEVKEFTYPLTVSFRDSTIGYGKAAVKTLSASESKQLMSQVQYIAARKSTSAPVRGMQIETSANIAR